MFESLWFRLGVKGKNMVYSYKAEYKLANVLLDKF